MEQLQNEIRHAARRLTHSPAFTIATVLTLALAIGANASIFAVVERVVLNPLPYPESDRLIELDHGALLLKTAAGFGTTPGLYFHYVERSRTLEGAALYRATELTLTGDGEPERIRVARATPSLAAVLRVGPIVGHWFTEQEATPGAARAAVLSHSLWARRFGRDAHVIGRPLTLGGEPATIVGVMPASFAFPDRNVDIWIAEQVTRAAGFGLWGYSGIARLREGITLEDARTELSALIRDLPAAFPNDALVAGNVESKLIFSGRTLKDATVGNVARALWLLLAAVGVVLLVACANVANLFLVRSEARQREVAVRRALGAGRAAIARYFLAESVLLSLVGGAVGVALAAVAVRLLVSVGPATLPRLHEVRLDPASLSFTFGVSLIAAVAFGTMPLWRAPRLAASLHDGGRSNTASRSRHRARHLLMAGQIALALVLLVASGLMVRSFQQLRAIDTGFNATNALTFTIGLPGRTYPSRQAAVAAHHAILDRLSAVPGVSAASASTCLPLAGACYGNTMLVQGRPSPPGTLPPLGAFRAVAAGFFDAMGMRIVRGRGITRDDIERSERVAVVDDLLAKRYFADRDPIGERIASNRPPARPGELPTVDWLTIVGVVASTPVRTLVDPAPLGQVYMAMSIAGGPDIPAASLVGPDVSAMSYVVRFGTPTADLLVSVRHAIDAIDRNLAIAQVRTLQEILDRAAGQMAFTMVLLAIAATVALMLGVIGIYGVMSYIVSQRTAEIGVRMALGAEPGSVAAQIVQQGGLVALVGIAVGLAAALGGSQVIASLLYGVSPRDPAVFAATTMTLLVVALVACWLPARRAARLSPLEALRTD
jgi:putative ABC transport system permease protein